MAGGIYCRTSCKGETPYAPNIYSMVVMTMITTTTMMMMMIDGDGVDTV